ncbi:transposase [Streptomyces sp. NBC_00287]
MLYEACRSGGLNHDRIDVDRLRTVLAGLPLPHFDGGRLVLAVDVSPWLRSDAPCSAGPHLRSPSGRRGRILCRPATACLTDRQQTAAKWSKRLPRFSFRWASWGRCRRKSSGSTESARIPRASCGRGSTLW